MHEHGGASTPETHHGGIVSPSTRRLIRIPAFALAVTVALALTSSIVAAKDDWVPGKYMNQALVRVMASVRRITEKTKYGLDDASTCFIGALVVEGKQVTTRIPLKAGTEYALIGGGDDDVKDMDLYLEDSDGNIVAKDDATDSNPVVVYTPKEDGKYRVVMKLVSTKATSSFCCYATLRDGGFDVPVSNLAAASGKLLALCERINDKLGWAAFHDGDGELCLIGSIMSQGQTLTQGGFVLEDRPYAFVGTADAVAEDIDIKLTDSDGTSVASDTETDATPIVIYKKGGTVAMKLSDVKSKGPTLCLAAAVKLKS
jgi:hypothetical protein